MKIEEIQVGRRYWLQKPYGEVDACYVLGKSETDIVCQFSHGFIWSYKPENVMCEMVEFAKPKQPWWKFW